MTGATRGRPPSRRYVRDRRRIALAVAAVVDGHRGGRRSRSPTSSPPASRWPASPARRRQQSRRRSCRMTRRRGRCDHARAASALPIARWRSEEMRELPEIVRPRGAALRRDRSARRLVQHRHQHVRRHDLLDPAARRDDLALDLLSSPARRSCAAGFVIYGPQTSLVLDARRRRRYLHARPQARAVPSDRAQRRADLRGMRRSSRSTPPTAGTGIAPVRAFIDDCLAGVDGPRDKDFNMRWIGSLVAEAYRILIRGGVFLYPADARPGYRDGRLRLLYEAHPMAMIIEQAGGAAIDRARRASSTSRAEPASARAADLGLDATRCSASRYCTSDPAAVRQQRAPLFARRGLFRL